MFQTVRSVAIRSGVQFSARLSWISVVFLGIGIWGCQGAQTTEPFAPSGEKDYNRPLPPGQLALRKIDPKDYPDFVQAWKHREGLDPAIQNSLNYLALPSSRKYYPYGDVTHERAVASLTRFREVLHSARTAEDLDDAIRREFDVYQSIGCDDMGTVFFTGYYTPVFEARTKPDGRFRYPLYAAPPDLVKDAEGNVLGRRKSDGAVVPYFTRRQIEEERLLDGTEVVWLKDPFECYVVNVQGSAKLRLEDGSILELGYAGNNGHQYKSVGRQMISDGVLTKKDLSLQAMMRFFQQHPGKVYAYTWQNPRYVFFKPVSGGPFGSIGVPVTTGKTIATDKAVFPRASLAFIETRLPRKAGDDYNNRPYSGFHLDQDTGGAIRAPGRCDVYMGVGADAEASAGRTGSEGHLYYLFLKDGMSQVASGRATQQPVR